MHSMSDISLDNFMFFCVTVLLAGDVGFTVNLAGKVGKGVSTVMIVGTFLLLLKLILMCLGVGSLLQTVKNSSRPNVMIGKAVDFFSFFYTVGVISRLIFFLYLCISYTPFPIWIAVNVYSFLETGVSLGQIANLESLHRRESIAPLMPPTQLVEDAVSLSTQL